MRSEHHCGKSRSTLRSTVEAMTWVSSAGLSATSAADVLLVVDCDPGDTAGNTASGLSWTDVDVDELPSRTSRRSLF